MKKVSTEVTVGFFMVLGFAVFSIFAVKFGSGSLFSEKGFTLKAKFNTISGLKKAANVEIAGVNVGKVKNIVLSDGQALVTMIFAEGVIIYSDAVASVRTKGIIGETYIKIDPGVSKTPLVDNALIDQTKSPVDLEELIGSVKKMVKNFPLAGSSFEVTGESYAISAKFTSVVGLKVDAPVEIAGVPVGQVKGITLEGNKAKVAMLILKDVKIEDDSMASVRTKGFIGEKFVKITPGASETYLAQDGALQDTESVVDIEELIGKFIYGNK